MPRGACHGTGSGTELFFPVVTAARVLQQVSSAKAGWHAMSRPAVQARGWGRK